MTRSELLELVRRILALLDRAIDPARRDREPYSLPVDGADDVLTELIVAYDQLAMVRDALAA